MHALFDSNSPLGGEKLFSPAGLAARSRYPGQRGAKMNASTITRKILKGHVSPSGVLIRLEAVRVGNRWLTSLEALDRFVAAVTAAHLAPASEPAPPPASLGRRARAQDAASAELDRLLAPKRKPKPE